MPSVQDGFRNLADKARRSLRLRRNAKSGVRAYNSAALWENQGNYERNKLRSVNQPLRSGSARGVSYHRSSTHDSQTTKVNRLIHTSLEKSKLKPVTAEGCSLAWNTAQVPSGDPAAKIARSASAPQRGRNYAEFGTATSIPMKASPPWVREGADRNVVEDTASIPERTNKAVIVEIATSEEVFRGGITQPLVKEHVTEVTIRRHCRSSMMD